MKSCNNLGSLEGIEKALTACPAIRGRFGLRTIQTPRALFRSCVESAAFRSLYYRAQRPSPRGIAWGRQNSRARGYVTRLAGNTLRALVKYLDGVSDADIPAPEIPTGIPFVYELDESLHPLARYYLGASPVAAQAQEDLDRVIRISGSMPQPTG